MFPQPFRTLCLPYSHISRNKLEKNICEHQQAITQYYFISVCWFFFPHPCSVFSPSWNESRYFQGQQAAVNASRQICDCFSPQCTRPWKGPAHFNIHRLTCIIIAWQYRITIFYDAQLTAGVLLLELPILLMYTLIAHQSTNLQNLTLPKINFNILNRHSSMFWYRTIAKL